MTSKNNKPEIKAESTPKKVDETSKSTESKPVNSPTEKPTSTAQKSEPAKEKPAATTGKEADYATLEKQAKRGSKLGTVAILIALILGGGAAGYAYKMTQEYQSNIDTMNETVKGLESKLSEANSQISAFQKVADGFQSLTDEAAKKAEEADKKFADIERRSGVELDQHEKSLESLQKAFAELKGRRTNDWLLAEADYLVKLAGRKLFLERDVVTATHLMESADQRVSSLNDPSLTPLRKALADDITTLKAVPLIDSAGLVLRLTSLQEQVEELPLANASLPDAPKTEESEVSNDINNWKENLLTSVKSFSENFITFRARDGSAVPLLTPEQHFYLRENIKSQLAIAIRAVYNEQQDLYTSSLNTTLSWSSDFFNLESSNVTLFNEMVTQLSEQKVQVEYPVKLDSQALLSDVINERLRREVAGLIKEENTDD